MRLGRPWASGEQAPVHSGLEVEGPCKWGEYGVVGSQRGGPAGREGPQASPRSSKALGPPALARPHSPEFPESGARAPPAPWRPSISCCFLFAFGLLTALPGGVLRSKTGARSSWRADETEKVVWTDLHTHGLMASVTAPWSL